MADCVTFTVNGEEYSVGSEVPSDVMLLDYLRNYLQLRGTKYMCREGGCGACIVTASKGSGEPSIAVNSCLVAVTQCHGWDITTIEGLGNRKKGYHTIQKTLAEHHGTQCGYCSPGMVMALYGFLNLTKKPTMLEIEKAFGSNLCRCTGYRSILEGFKKFGVDAPTEVKIRDIEDLTICKKIGKSCKKSICEDEWYVVKGEGVNGSEIKTITLKDGKIWYRPSLLEDVLTILQGIDSDDYSLIGGNTAKGVNPINDCPSVMIDLNAIQELKVIELDQNLVVGAGLTLTEFLDVLQTYSEKDYFGYLQKIYHHVDMIAHIPVRNMGTLGGNLMIKHKKNAFQSDLYLLLETVDAQVTIVDKDGTQCTITMQDFLLTNMQGKVIVNILLPPRNSDEYKLVTYKIMPRSQSSHAIVNAGFLYKLSTDNIVEECRIVYSALSSNFMRPTATETYLVGKSLFTNATLQGALQILDAELVVTDTAPEPSVEFRTFLAKSLFYKGLLYLCPSSLLCDRYVSGSVNLHDERGVSEGTQTYPTDSTKYPLGQPIGKLEGTIQCAGEAQYTEDIPSIPNEVFAAFVLSDVAIGTIVKIDASEALALDGVVAFYTAEDIPGLNSFTPADDFLYSSNEEVLAEGTVKYCHQPIAIVVAKTQHIANRASKLVTVKYSNTKDPVIDIKEARLDSSRNTLYISVDATNTGTDISKTITGTHVMYGQYHMTMETNVCVGKPTDQGIEIHSATQWLDGTHIMISRALNMDQNKIDVYVSRLGGGYGMKISRSIQCAVACSLVVHKLNRPCRVILPLTTNTKAIGKRFPCVNDYTVAVNSAGVIQYIDTNIYEDNGYMTNETITPLGYDVYNNCYDITKFNYKAYDTITDTAKNTWCRAPGTLEAITFMELTMERISYELCLDPVDVRLANLDTTKYSVMTEMIETLKTKAEYTTRKSAIDLFNAENRWKKRGLRINFVRWAPAAYLKFDVNLSIYHADGTVSISLSSVEMGQGINTKAAQMAAYFLGISVDKIQIKGINTICSPNTSLSGGSLGNQSVCIALKRCCDIMNERLEPIRATLDNPTWETLISTAYASDVDLQAHGYVGSADILSYNVYGMACCEVEADLLTGEYEINRLDLLQDVGFSLSPEIDIGQIEGALVMGLGYFTCEKTSYDSTGAILTERCWDIHLIEARDIPKILNVHILPNSYSTDIILGAKGTGEPAICLAGVATLALREAITLGRQECGTPTTTWFAMNGPCSNEKVCLLSLTSTDDFKFN